MMNEEKTITVTGCGNIQVVPDVTRVELQIKCVFDTYDTAYQMAEADLHDLSEVMAACGLSSKLPKTTHFGIDKAYRRVYEDGHYTGEDELIGYELDLRVKIDLGMDNKLLTKLVRTIGENLTNVEIRIGYTVQDPRPHQLKMLERAVKDATEKAEIMATAAGCVLGDVKSIDYSEQQVHIYSQARNIGSPCEAASCTEGSLDITPEDLCAGEDVTITWFLLNAE